MGYECKMILDSINPYGVRLTTMCVTFPRIVLAEFNTHRDFSRNSASSRAIPVERMIQRVLDDPFIPERWPINGKGMQPGGGYLEGEQAQWAKEYWLRARDRAVQDARSMQSLDTVGRIVGVHKEITNRLLEPWLWHTVIVSATRFSNFDNLRNNDNAQAQIHTIASMMVQCRNESTPTLENEGSWHIPYIDMYEWESYEVKDLLKIATGRIARVSYLTHEGVRDPQKDIELHDSLMKNGHMSPFEHCARVRDPKWITREQDRSNFDPTWWQYRKNIPNECR